MRHARLASLLAVALALVVAACSGGGTATSASVGPATDASRIEVKLTDAFQIELSAVTVPVGRPITFVVTNQGVIDHEFYLGDEAAQAVHEQEMMAGGGMAHDEAMGINLKAGETKELTVTFDAAGPMLAGCHIAGHYAAGMKATIDLTR